MSKAASVLMGLAFLGLGILGITGLMPMFQSDPIYLNIAEIVLGGLGLVVGIYSRKSNKHDQQVKDLNQQTKDTANRQRHENDQLRKENDQGKRDNADRQTLENEQLRKENDLQKQENERLKKSAAQENERQKKNTL